MILRRSSSRCSRKLIAGMVSCASPVGGTEAAISGILGLAVQFGSNCRWRRSARWHRSFRGTRRRQDLLRPCIGFHIIDLGFDLGLELVAGSLELVQGLSDLPPDLG